MNAVYFLEIKQDRQRRPENPPILPISVGKSPQQAIAPVYIQIRFREAQSDHYRLQEQERPQEGDR